MPAAIPLALGAGASSLVGGGLLGALVGGVVRFGASLLFQQEADTPDFTYQDQARGIQQNISNPVQPIPVIYGKYRLAGSRVFAEVNGSSNEYLDQVIVFCEGEIESIDDVYLDDIPATDARFSGLVSIYKHTGTDAQAADSVLVANTASWTANHKLSGIAYLYIRLRFDAEAFPKIPVVSADITGKRVTDVISSSYGYSNNPANCIYDYLTNTRYGRSIPASEIDIASFQAAHSICAATVSNSPEPAQNTYDCDGVINIDNSTLQNIRDMLTSCRAYLIFTSGKYRLIVDQAETSAYTFNEDNVIGNFAITLDAKTDRYNRVRVRYFNSDRKFQPDIYIGDSSTYRTDDNETLLERQFTLPFTCNYFRAKRIADIELEQSRHNILVEFVTTLEGLRAEVGDVVNITHSTPGWTNKKFRVLNIQLDSEDTIRVRAREYQNVYTPSIPTTPTSPPAVIPPPVTDTVADVAVEPDTSHIISFENGDVSGWTAGDGSISTTATACVGSVAGLVTHGGGGNLASVSYDAPETFAANVLQVVDNQIRVQLKARRPASGAADGFKMRIVGSSENSGWQSFTTSSSCESFGVNFKPTTPQTSLSLEIQGDSDDAGTDSTIIDNIVFFQIPDFIDADNIDTWIASAAIGTAYIADAAITNAKIGTAAVTTLKIGDDNVTVPRSFDAVSNLLTNRGAGTHNVWRDFPTPVTITLPARAEGSHGKVILEFFTVGISVSPLAGGANLSIGIFRDSTLLKEYIAFGPNPTTSSRIHKGKLSWVDDPGGFAAHDYKVMYRVTGTSPSGWSNTFIDDYSFYLLEAIK